MFCPHCGEEIADHSRYCGNCGYRIPRRFQIHKDYRFIADIKKSFMDPMKQISFSLPASFFVLILVFLSNLLLSYRILPGMLQYMDEILGHTALLGTASGYFKVSGSTHLVNALTCTIEIYVLVMGILALNTWIGKRKINFEEIFSDSSSILFLPMVLACMGTLLLSVPWLGTLFYCASMVVMLLQVDQHIPRELNGWWKILMLAVITVLILSSYSHAAVMIGKEAVGSILRYFMYGQGGF